LADRDWRRYYENTLERPPCEALLRALENIDPVRGEPCQAVDLGCGGGRDTVELLRRGWSVLAVDAEPAAIDVLTNREDLPATGHLETLVSRFEDAIWPRADLINSGFALPLVPQIEFDALWERIVGSLKPGGRISCQLYGDRDSWMGDPTVSFFTRAQIEAMLAGLKCEYFREEEDDSTTPRGTLKHWHVFHIVARCI
jgi:SAM-dependent methyltransferase